MSNHSWAGKRFRNFRDQYALVVSPSAELPVDDIRHRFFTTF